MKRTLLLTTLAASLLFSNRSEAQVPIVSKLIPKVTLGVKLGANFQQLSGDSWDHTFKPGILGGGFVGVFKKKIGVQAEVLFKTVRYNGATIMGVNTGHANGFYLDIPVLFEYKLVPRLWIQAGPQFSTMLGAYDQDNNTVKSSFKSTDIAGVIGIEGKLPLKLSVGARYMYGFGDINATENHPDSDKWHNSGFQIYAGFRFL